MKLSDFTLREITRKVANKMLSCLTTGREFSLSTFEIKELFEKNTCEYTGVKFKTVADATFERVNPFLDYVPGNVVLVSLIANTKKGLLDNFIKAQEIPIEMRIKLLRKATYALEKQLKEGVK